MFRDIQSKLIFLWSTPAETQIDPLVLNIYRVMLFLGQAVLVMMVVHLSMVGESVPIAPWFCYIYIALSFSLCVSTYLSNWTREYIGELTCSISFVLSIYVACALYASNLDVFELLYAVTLISFGCALYHKIRLIIIYCLMTASILAAGALMAAEPNIDPLLASVVMFGFGCAASFFRAVLVLAKTRKQQWDAVNLVWFEESTDGLLFGRTLTAEIVKSNHRMFELFECDDKIEVVNLLRRAFQATSPERAMRELLKEVVSDSSWQEDILFTTARGNTFWGRLTMSRVLVDQLTDLLLVKVTDVTQTVVYEKELEEAKELAEASVEVRSRFLANMSHEIRTPMNGVIGMTSLLRETELTAHQENLLETIRQSGESLLTVINEILDFSKLDASEVRLEQELFDLERCISEAMDIISPTATDKGIELLLEYQVNSPGLWIGDATRIRQVMVNLLSNAVKFTEQGKVVVTVSEGHCEPTATDLSRDEVHILKFEIEDTGIGITSKQLETLFDPFVQADISTTRKYGGTGLGLSICKGLVELMDGELSATSTPGRGSKFKFDLRLTASEQAVLEIAPAFPDKRAIIICDKPATSQNLSGYLKQLELNVECYASNCSWAESHEESENIVGQDHYPDVIFTNQPVQNLRAHANNAAIVNFSPSMNSDEGSEAAIRSLRWPVRSTEVAQLLTAIFDTSQSQVTKHEISKIWDDLPLRGESFLLVEDNIVNQQVAIQFLSKLGIQADVVSNGREAVDMVHQQYYDFIFMDLQMPEIDGLEATQLIRLMELPKQPYIIAMTANAMVEDRQICMENGMDDFISKPVRLNDMHSTLKQALVHNQQQG